AGGSRSQGIRRTAQPYPAVRGTDCQGGWRITPRADCRRSAGGGDGLKTNTMTVAGVMSGTSADGVDVALVRIEKRRGRPTLTLLAHEGYPYPAALRR